MTKPLEFRTTHDYALSQRPDELVRWAADAAHSVARILKDIGEDRSPVFCYAGSSGIGQATALSIAYYSAGLGPFGMAYVRKENEESHGHSVELSLNTLAGRTAVLVFVDDLICSGRTQERVMKKAFAAVLEWISDRSYMPQAQFLLDDGRSILSLRESTYLDDWSTWGRPPDCRLDDVVVDIDAMMGASETSFVTVDFETRRPIAAMDMVALERRVLAEAVADLEVRWDFKPTVRTISEAKNSQEFEAALKAWYTDPPRWAEPSSAVRVLGP